MKLITDLIHRLETFENGLKSGLYLQNIIQENEAFIIDLNAQNQLYEQGITSIGVNISDYAPYSDLTLQIKELKGQPTDRVTLRDEGDFESSFYLQISDTQFEIKAADGKTEDLIKKYGHAILGLTNENLGLLIQDYIFPEILKLRDSLVYGKD